MSVLVVSEHRRGTLREVSYEAITAGRELADAQGGDLHVAAIGGDVDRFAEDLNREGVDAIHTVANGEEFDHTVYQSAVGALLDATDAETVVIPNSVNGLDYAPAVAEARDLELVTDAIGFEHAAVVNDLDVDADAGVAHVRRELEGGVEELTDVDLPAVLTVQTGLNEPRYASLRGIRQAQRKEIDATDLADLGLTADDVESALTITEMYEPESESDAEIIEGDAGESAGRLAEVLREKGVSA